MKSILIGDPAMCKHAFPASVRAQLAAWTQLPDAPAAKEEILAQPDLYRDTELIFSTWDMPHFTREELQKCFPALRAVFYAAGSVQHFAREFLAAGAHVFSAWAANAIRDAHVHDAALDGTFAGEFDDLDSRTDLGFFQRFHVLSP